MQPINFEESIDKIIAADGRYAKESYFFLREALDYTKRATGRSRGDNQHVSGGELLEGIRAYALESFGPMTMTVLAEWGIRECADFGEIVFNMIEQNLLGKSDRDSRADFKEGYNFQEAFRRPFMPARSVAPVVERGSCKVGASERRSA